MVYPYEGTLHFVVTLTLTLDWLIDWLISILIFTTLSLWPNIDAHFKGGCVTLISSVCLNWKKGPSGSPLQTTSLSSLFPFARKLGGTTQAGTAFFATDCSFALIYLLSWPSLLNPWLKRYIETQSSRADINAAWLLLCAGLCVSYGVSHCFGLLPSHADKQRDWSLSCSSK